MALGPVSGGVLLEHFGWGAIFLVNVPLALFALVAGRRLLPESRHLPEGRFDVPGAAMSVAAITVLVWTLIEAPDNGWTSTTTLGGFLLAAIAMAAFVWRETHITAPLFDVRLFKNARFSAASASVALAFFGLFGFIFLSRSTSRWSEAMRPCARAWRPCRSRWSPRSCRRWRSC